MRVILGLLSCLALTACSAAPAPISFPSPIPTPSASVSADPEPSATPSAVASPSSTPSKRPAAAVVAGTFKKTASGGTGVLGTAGSLKRYCVQVEDGIDSFTPEQVASVVDQVLGDHRSWIAGKKYMFQRMPSCGGVSLQIRLAVPKTVDRLCRPAADTQGRYSCRNGNNIFLNLDRWTIGVPHFPDLAVYRNMLVNHEVGHFLGHGHVPCSGVGQLAPVMQRQSASLDGCQLNPHPYPDGLSYHG